jgi:hypothetical protein
MWVYNTFVGKYLLGRFSPLIVYIQYLLNYLCILKLVQQAFLAEEEVYSAQLSARILYITTPATFSYI